MELSLVLKKNFAVGIINRPRNIAIVYLMYMTLRKSLVYLLILTLVGAMFTYGIVVRAYQDEGQYDIENLQR